MLFLGRGKWGQYQQMCKTLHCVGGETTPSGWLSTHIIFLPVHMCWVRLGTLVGNYTLPDYKGIKNVTLCKDYQFYRDLGSLNCRFFKSCSQPGGPLHTCQVQQDVFFASFPGDHGEWLGLKRIDLAETLGCLNSLCHIWTKWCLNTSWVRELILSVKIALTCIFCPCLSLLVW